MATRGILMYHSIDETGSPVSIGAAAFDRHVGFLAGGAVRVTSLEDLGGTDGDAVALTFDDAFASFATEAWPRLRDHGLPATLYVVTDHVGGTNRWGGVEAPGIPELPLLDWDTLGRLAEDGVSLGCHSRTHPHLPDVDDARLDDEVAGARAELERRTGAAPTSFAYPYGSVDARSRASVAQHFTHACTTELRTLDPGDDARLLPRLDAFYFQRPGRLESWGSARFFAYVKLRAAARSIKSLLTARGRSRV